MRIRSPNIDDKTELKLLLHDFYINDKKKYSQKTQKWEQYKNEDDVIEATASKYITDRKYIIFVLGYIVGEIKEKPHKLHNKEGYVQDWFVQAEYRWQKVGKLLFEKLLQEFKQLHCTHIALDCFVENKKTIDIYHHMGFEDKLLVLRKEL
jgi:GNAT superfamily N-acetyltransferase